MNRTALWLCGVSLVVVVCQGQPPSQRPQPGASQTTLNQVLSWLPADTETVVGVNGPFPLPDLTKLDNESLQAKGFSAELGIRTKMLALNLLNFENGSLMSYTRGKTVAVAVEGSRRFRSPTALGEMLFEGCDIVVFSGAVKLERDAFVKNAASSAKRFETVEGTSVAVFEEEQENDTWTTFVGFPRNNVLLVATNLDYLQTVSVRMRGATGPKALPGTLPEWKYVNTVAPAWGVRHYQRREFDQDPSSPFLEQAEANIPDDKAIGVTFWFDPVNRKAVVNYLSANSGARKVLADHLSMEDAATASPREFQVRLRQPAPGVIEGSVALSGPEALYRFIFGVMGMLGHAVYL